MGKKLPWMKFDLDDWNNDAELQMCSLDTQGFLLKLMGLMSRTSPPGYLRINGSLPDNKSLSRALKVHPKTCSKCLKELQENGVLKQDGDDWYSQRMLSDWEEYLIAVETGKKGGNPKLLNPMVNGGVKGGVKAPLKIDKETDKEVDKKKRVDLPPHLSAFAEEARKIPDWNFTTDQETSFFETLCQDFPADIITKATRDLHAYQLSEGKPYKNPMRALRNWCAKEKEWRQERPDEKPEPAKDEQGNVLIPIDGELVAAPEFDRLLGEHAIYKTPDGWKRKEVS